MKLIKQNEINDVWDSVKYFVQQALDVANEYYLDTIRDKLLINELSLAVTDDGKFVCVLNIYQCDQGKVMNIFLASGDFDNHAQEAYEFMVDLARQEDCYSILFTGRPGWKKYIKEYGFKIVSTQMRKCL